RNRCLGAVVRTRSSPRALPDDELPRHGYRVEMKSRSWQRPQLASGVARVDAGLDDISRHHRSGADHRIAADGHGKDRGVRTGRHAIADLRRFPELAPAARRPAVSERVIDEHDAVGDDAIVADSHQFADERMGLDAAASSDTRVALNLDERPDEAAV